MRNLFILLTALLLTSPVQAATPPAASEFCRSHGNICKGYGESTIIVTDEVMNVLKSVNSSINNRISFVNETGNSWTLNPSQGDCDDYAISKRAALMAAGLPSNALRIAFGFANGVPHAVLLVMTDKGPLVLDNRRSSISSVSRSGVVIVSISKGNISSGWVAP